MMDNDERKTLLMIIIILELLTLGLGIFVGEQNIRADAIKNCKAAYVLIDNSTGATEFRWNPPLTPEDYK